MFVEVILEENVKSFVAYMSSLIAEIIFIMSKKLKYL